MVSIISIRAARSPVTRTTACLLRQPRQLAFSTSHISRLEGDGKDIGPGKTHVTDKSGGHKDIQSEASHAGQEKRASGSESSQATSEKDVGNNNERAKKDHPEAPEPVIGMNEERGGKGH